MRIIEIIKEDYRADLYHGTTLPKAENIVQSNKLVAHTPIHNLSIASKDSKTVSLTRDITTAVRLAGDFSDIKVVFVLDGSKLYQRYGKKIRPYDDTETDSYKQNLRKYGYDDRADSKVRTRIQPGGNEREEAVFGDIDNLDSFIKKIIIFYDPNSGGDDKEKLRQIVSKSPLLNHPKVEFGGLKAQYARSSRQVQSRLSKNHPLQK